MLEISTAAGPVRIPLESLPCVIGRDCPLFTERAAVLPGVDFSGISRRHVEIAVSDGQPSLRDLGSLNGTACNGRLVGADWIVLHDGDQIALGDGFTFRVILEPAALPEAQTAPSAAPTTRGSDALTLPPEALTLGADAPTLPPGTPQILDLIPLGRAAETTPIRVTSFPFLFGREQPCFAAARALDPQLIKNISRQHAEIATRRAVFYCVIWAAAMGPGSTTSR